MATLIKNNTKQVKQYSSDPKDMLVLAKSYAKKDFSQSIDLIQSLGFTVEDHVIAEALIQLKYSRIENVRNQRVTYFD